jgi:hypothetical protein
MIPARDTTPCAGIIPQAGINLPGWNQLPRLESIWRNAVIRTQLRRYKTPEILADVQPSIRDWLWDGYLDPGSITLLTSQWKTGKTTLVTGLLQCLEHGGPFLGRTLRPGKGLIVSEESEGHWAERLRRMPLGPNVEIMPRPFPSRPTHEQWNELIDEACLLRLDGQLDLLVVDPAIMFLPGHWESNPTALVDAFQPLHRLTSEGASVLILHHPRRKKSEPGHSARGTGALLGVVDIALELNRYGRLLSDSRRRQIITLSRNPRTPERLVYEWDPATSLFQVLSDPRHRRFEENWPRILKILQGRKEAATHHELLMDWPDDDDKPAASVFYEWLNRAFEQKRLRRKGAGRKTDPFRYRLENDDDQYYDRGEIPPLPPFEEVLRERAP